MLAKEERFEIRGGGTTVGSAVADIVQCGSDRFKLLRNHGLHDEPTTHLVKSLILNVLLSWLAALDGFRNWLIREAA
jgi:hypothetical protein